MFPWLTFLHQIGSVATLSDMMFLMKKEFDGKLVHDEGNVSATGDIATLTASGGKDMYLAKAKVNARLTGTTTTAQSVTVELKANGTVVGTWKATFANNTGTADRGGGTTSDTYEFAMSGLKVAATQIIKIEATSVGTGCTLSAELVCVEETTGETPVI